MPEKATEPLDPPVRALRYGGQVRSQQAEMAGAGYALGAFLLWVLADTALKLAGRSSLPIMEVLGWVSAVELLLLGAWAVTRGSVRGLWPHQPGRAALRALLDLGNNVCVVVALRHLPLATFYLSIFVAPLLTSAAAALFLAEGLDAGRLAALLAGFAGVVISVAPGLAAQLHAGDWVGYAACAVCVACFSASLVWGRVLSQGERPEALTFLSALVILGAAVASGALTGWAPVPPHLGLVLGCSGIAVLGGSLCFFLALRRASAARVVQFHYTQLPAGVLVGYALWRERPTWAMVAGGALIIAAGLWTAGLEAKAAGPAAAEPGGSAP